MGNLCFKDRSPQGVQSKPSSTPPSATSPPKPVILESHAISPDASEVKDIKIVSTQKSQASDLETLSPRTSSISALNTTLNGEPLIPDENPLASKEEPTVTASKANIQDLQIKSGVSANSQGDDKGFDKKSHNHLSDKSRTPAASSVSSSEAATGPKSASSHLTSNNNSYISSSNTLQSSNSSAYVFGVPRGKETTHSHRKRDHNVANNLEESTLPARKEPSSGSDKKSLYSSESGGTKISSKSSSAAGTSQADVHASISSGADAAGSSVATFAKVPEGDEKDAASPVQSSSLGDEEGSSEGEFAVLDPPAGSDSANYLNLVTSIFQLPIALVASFSSRCVYLLQTASLADRTADENWRRSLSHLCADIYLKGGAGLNAEGFSRVITIPDMSVDERYKNFYCVQSDPRITFLMASPLKSSTGAPLGCLCVADFMTRTLDPNNLLVLDNLQKVVVSQLERDAMLAKERSDVCVEAQRLENEMLRALDHFEKAIMFVDTGSPGWRILYTNQAWLRVSGTNPKEVIGVGLQGLLCAKGGIPINFKIFAAPLAAQAELVIPEIVLKGRMDKVISLKMRLATAEGSVESILAPGLPNFVKDRGTTSHNYFVLIEEEVEKVDSDIIAAAGNYEVLTKHVSKVPGLELSHMLGKGGFGSVYYGTWMGEAVAVKMIDNKVCKVNAAGNSIEAAMGMELDHSNIVRTLKFFVRNSNSRSNSSAEGANSSNPRQSNQSGSPSRLHSRNSHSKMRAGEEGKTSLTSLQMLPMTSAQVAAASVLTCASDMHRDGIQVVSGATTTDSERDVAVNLNPANMITSRQPSRRESSASRFQNAPSNLGPHHVSGASTYVAGEEHLYPHSSSRVGSRNDRHPVEYKSGFSFKSGSSSTTPSSAGVGGVEITFPQADGDASSTEGGTTVCGGSRPANVLRNSNNGRTKLALANPVVDEEETDDNLSTHSFSRFSEDDDHTKLLNATPNPRVNGSTSTGVESGSRTKDDQSEIWIIMEFCNQGSLQDALDQGSFIFSEKGGGGLIADRRGMSRPASSVPTKPNLDFMICTALEICSALAYLHNKGIMHGDLTAWNVLLTATDKIPIVPAARLLGVADDPNAVKAKSPYDIPERGFTSKVADFGLSRVMEVVSKIKTRTYGTITHMPPETLINGIISKAADVFSFGVLLWQMYTSQRPWGGMNHGQIIFNVGMKNMQLQYPPGTPRCIEQLGLACTRSSPRLRPPLSLVHAELERMWNKRREVAEAFAAVNPGDIKLDSFSPWSFLHDFELDEAIVSPTSASSLALPGTELDNVGEGQVPGRVLGSDPKPSPPLPSSCLDPSSGSVTSPLEKNGLKTTLRAAPVQATIQEGNGVVVADVEVVVGDASTKSSKPALLNKAANGHIV